MSSIPTYNFWRENKTANHYVLTPDEIKAKFKEWMRGKDKQWLDYYNTWDVVLCFIGEVNGLNSVNEPKEIQSMVTLLKPLKFSYITEGVFV